MAQSTRTGQHITEREAFQISKDVAELTRQIAKRDKKLINSR